MKYEVKILEGVPFEPEPGRNEYEVLARDSSAVVTTVDESGKIKKVTYGLVRREEVYSLIKQGQSINLNRCYLGGFSLKEYRELENISFNKRIQVRLKEARDSFFDTGQSFEQAIGMQIYPDKYVSGYSNVDFSMAQFDDGFVNFNRARFGDGNVIFREAQFGDGDVDFYGAKFGKGDVDFREVRFGKGDVNFSWVQFDAGNVFFERVQFDEGVVNFRCSRFGEGDVFFREAQFDKGYVDFSEVQFSDGDVDFNMAKLGDGGVNFNFAQFGRGKVIFEEVQFGDGDVTFVEVQFGDGYVTFNKDQFGKGEVVFCGAKFGEGSVYFKNVQFGDGKASFAGVQFGDVVVDFGEAQFGKGDVDFREAQFSKGNLYFSEVQFGDGNVYFQKAQFGEGNVDFSKVQFGDGDVFFNDIQNTGDVGATIIFSNCVFSHHVKMNNTKCTELLIEDCIIEKTLNLEGLNTTRLSLKNTKNLGQIFIKWEEDKVSVLDLLKRDPAPIRADQLVILKENFHNIGRYDDEDKAYVNFKRCEWNARFHELRNGKLSDKVRIPGHLLFRFVTDYLSEYATNPWRILGWMIGLFIAFTGIYYLNPYMLDLTGKAMYSPRLKACISYSLATFLTIGYGNITPDNSLAVALSGIEGFSGVFLTAYFTVAFARKILR